MAMEYNYLYSLTFNQIHNAIEGYQRKQEREIKERYEQTRLIAFYSAFTFESKNKNMTPQKLIPFEWDEYVATKKGVSNFKEAQEYIKKHQS